jgi:hypothetical protein
MTHLVFDHIPRTDRVPSSAVALADLPHSAGTLLSASVIPLETDFKLPLGLNLSPDISHVNVLIHWKTMDCPPDRMDDK